MMRKLQHHVEVYASAMRRVIVFVYHLLIDSTVDKLTLLKNGQAHAAVEPVPAYASAMGRVTLTLLLLWGKSKPALFSWPCKRDYDTGGYHLSQKDGVLKGYSSTASARVWIVCLLLAAEFTTGAAADTLKNFPLAPPGAKPRHRLHCPSIAATALAAVVVVAAAILFTYLLCCRRTRRKNEDGVRPGDVQVQMVPLPRAPA